MNIEIQKKVKEAIERQDRISRVSTTANAMKEAFLDPDNDFIISVFDLNNYKFVTMSESIKKFTGYEPSEMEGNFFINFLSENGKKLAEESIEVVDKNREENDRVTRFETIYLHKDKKKEVYITWWSSTTIKKNGHVICFADVTDIKPIDIS